MSKGDRDARVLQDATGAKYTTCLARVRGLCTLAPAVADSHSVVPSAESRSVVPSAESRSVVPSTRSHSVSPPAESHSHGVTHLDAFMDRVEALPDLIDGQVRCVACLQDLTPVRHCVCLSR